MAASQRGRSGTFIAAAIFTAMLAGILYRYWPDEERSIRRHISNLAEALSFPSVDAEVQRITRFAALREYFAPDVTLLSGSFALTSRDDVVAALQRVQAPPGGIAVEPVDVEVALSDDRKAASVRLKVKTSSTDPSTGTSAVEVRLMALSMSKASGDWVIVRGETSAQD